MSRDARVIGGIVVATIIILVGGVFLMSKQSSQEASVPQDQIISRNGIHWHPEIKISILGKIQEIPAGIGLSITEKPVHTHDSMGVIHLESKGLVKKDDVHLGRFFEIWGKQFNKDCIFDKCNGSEGKVKMFINGKENFEFENYIMKDHDKIEIVFE